MISLTLTSQKTFISHLLLKDTFDNFQFIEGEIVTFNKFNFDGYIQKTFYEDTENLPEYSSWKQVKDYCFSIIKGRQTPLSFRFIFRLSPQNTERLLSGNSLDFKPEDIQGLYLNISFDANGLKCITGTSLKIFSLDKSLEKMWDSMVQKFFEQKEIPFDVEL
ncbi:MAG: DUF5721 family protein [Schaedlerella sp.]|nr:DUF5721 family protein [Schaedlerella sp.]